MFLNVEKEIQENHREISSVELRLASGIMASGGNDKLVSIANKLAVEERCSLVTGSSSRYSKANDGVSDIEVIKELTSLLKVAIK